jgi:hypothetical protein
MRYSALALALGLALTACASNGGDRASDVLPGEQSRYAKTKQVVNAVGTPVHAVVKGASCVVVFVLALPVESAAQIHGMEADQAVQRNVNEGGARTCGGSYALQVP